MSTQVASQLVTSLPGGSPYRAVPLLDLKAQFATIRAEVMEAVQRVLESQHFILGPEVEALEREVAAYVGTRFSIGCASGSDALLLALMALGIGPGDEVITTVFTFGATASSISRLGARPVFVDIHPATFNLDERQIETVITSRTRAIMPVHLFGLPAEMGTILEVGRKYNLPVVEDAAQAIGARWWGDGIGSLGTCGCFSFFPSKNLGGCGDGGMITTNDSQLAERLRVLRVHGARTKYKYEMLGMNSRLDALQAAILRVKLSHLSEWTASRERNAATYMELLGGPHCAADLVVPTTQKYSSHVFNQYTVRAANRDGLREHLSQRRIATEIYYPSPLHREPAFAGLGYKQGEFPMAETVCSEVLSLPIFPELCEDQQRHVATAIQDFYESSSRKLQ